MDIDRQYRKWIEALGKRYRSSQIKAAISVNREMLEFYWSLGRDIVAMDAENKYGAEFYSKLSSDLKHTIPNASGFSVTNLNYMKYFYRLTWDLYQNLPQAGEEFRSNAEIIKAKESDPQNLPQVVEEFMGFARYS